MDTGLAITPESRPCPRQALATTSRLRCPYCRSMFAQPDGNRCPNCARTMRIPLRFQMHPADIERQRLIRMARDRYNERQALRRKALRSLGFSRRSWMIIALACLILLGVALPFHYAQHKTPIASPHTKEVRATESLWALRTALECFRQDCNRYPTAAEGLRALVVPPDIPGWRGPYIDLLRLDPWRRPYDYVLTSDQVSLSSAGPDGTAGTPDDLAAPRPDYTLLKQRNAARLKGATPTHPTEYTVTLQP